MICNYSVINSHFFIVKLIVIGNKLYVTWDTTELIKAIKKYFPKAVAFQAWGGSWSMSNNLNAKQLLEDHWIINRGDFLYKSHKNKFEHSRKKRKK